jgi:hypothetical protein
MEMDGKVLSRTNDHDKWELIPPAQNGPAPTKEEIEQAKTSIRGSFYDFRDNKREDALKKAEDALKLLHGYDIYTPIKINGGPELRLTHWIDYIKNSLKKQR